MSTEAPREPRAEPPLGWVSLLERAGEGGTREGGVGGSGVNLPPIAVDVLDEDVVGGGLDGHAFVFVCHHDLGGVSTTF